MMAAGFMHRTQGDDSIYERTIISLCERVKPLLWERRLKDHKEDILDRARALEITDFHALLAEHIAINKDLREEPAASTVYPDDLAAAMTQHVKSVFDKYNQNLTATKNALGISLNTLKKYLAKA